MTEQEYNAAEGVRRSDLWKMNDSPEKFLYAMTHPDEPTPALVFGAACHKWILEYKDFLNEYVIAPTVDRRTKAGKEAWENFCAENAGKTVISNADFDLIEDMGNALMDHELAGSFMFGKGSNEGAFFWTDPETGEKCKCKCDRLIERNGRIVIVDYKTARSAQTEKFNSAIFSHGYHVQAAMYTEGVQTVMKLDYRPGFVFVAQEKDAPYAVNVIEVTEDVMEYADRVYHDLLRKYHECKEMDVWPGYAEDVANECWLPGWAENETEEE